MSDSEDDIPLVQRAAAPSAKSTPKPAAAKAAAKPAAAQPQSRARTNGASKKKPETEDEDDDEESEEASSSSESEDEDSESDLPLAKRRKSKSPGAASTGAKRKRATPQRESEGAKRSKREPGSSKSGQVMWKTLRHCGVLFPPEYEPHGVKMLYDGKPVTLTPEQEEVATMFAVMKDTDYMKKPVFLKNFWEGFKEVLGKNHVIKTLDKCDFTSIYDWHMAQREAKKNVSKEEKDRIKKDKDEKEAKYKVAYVDGRPEPVGNFRVEPPGLFRGRGEHPKMGKIKRRVYPRDITINIGEGEPVPEHPYPGQTWKEIKHDHTVTWLAYWKDTISSKDYKYVFLGATSTFKADSDLAKYEKARKLKDLIVDVRKNYERDWESSDNKKRQMGVAMYFIDKLALRAGHEKDEDEADTVGCCTLKVENVDLEPGNKVKFDFLGKDSIRYENVVEVHPTVYKNLERFRRIDSTGKKKKPGDQLFETFDAQDLNKELKNIMDGLSVKVFRTYNASITLDRLLSEWEASKKGADVQSVDQKKVDYDVANKEVAILCNHQRSVPKTHTNQMEKIQEKLQALSTELKELEDELAAVQKGKGEGKKASADSLLSRIEKKKQAIFKVELQARSKEDLKTVALGTSKINYMDPRITIAWCKRNEVPIEKIFNKSLLGKFNWAMDVEPSFRF
ncbi:DNA topoisomerase 1 [Pleodorina starrii]|uniref:DNA topoisomerase I n=1 Tax=Pleodorina starrii TaxID=330485 RepID=A0A9W6BFG4_9CHLO|nr:DNA topoisomerase 1 [Pleodorina starrii]GLC51197.1 DNA topoisomerase 1 [Pleodorina starrii]GLC63555.1 DNA topoisomerase 1 [Pleodorina starrii]